jgi:ABC-type transport system involved in multi-copper enzyme maturation permease subunit
MNAVLRSEFRKLRTTRTVFGLLAGAVVLAGLALWGSLSSATPAELAAGLTAPFGYSGIVIIVLLFVMVLGIRSFTDEVRHGSVVPTFLSTPKRLRVLAAKMTVSAAAAVVFAVATLAVGTGVIAVYLIAHGFAVPVAWWTMGALFGKAIAIAVLWAAIGVSTGVVVRHQVAAIVGALAWLFVVENILSASVPKIAAWLPASAAGAAMGIESANTLVTPAVGMIVLIGWTVGAVALAATMIRRRDVA